jgi:PAS domain S-box-containing protein
MPDHPADMTELAQTLFEEIADALVLFDPETEAVLEVNPMAQRLTRFSYEALLAKNLTTLFRSEVRGGLDNLRRSLRATQTFHSQEGFLMARADGSWLPVNLTITRLHARTRTLGMLLARDVTEHKRALAAMRQAVEAAEAASRAKTQFVANVSHELRTPMNGILGMTELTLDTPLTDEQREYLTVIKSSAESLLNVLNEVLDFSKVEAGKIELEAIDFSLREELGTTLKGLGYRARAKGLSLLQEMDEQVPDRLTGDPGRLKQILVNLVGNAIKFTDQGTVTVRVRLQDAERRAPAGKDQASGLQSAFCLVQFSVSDTGIGIPADKLGAIFRPFEQAEEELSRKYGGTGLGLAIVSWLVELMGGQVWVDSVVGQGSTFHYTAVFGLPRQGTPGDARPSVGAAPAPSAPAPAPESNVRVGRALDILLADDHEVNRKLLVALFKRKGHRITPVGTGQEALDLLERGSFDLVLMDVQMPEMDGLAVTREIRARERAGRKRTPIIALTAHSLEGDRERFLAAGMDGFVSKPFKFHELFAEIDRVLAPAE